MSDLERAYWGQMYSNAVEQGQPSVLFRPKLFPDGDKWCALFGDNIQEGVAGFGDTPAKAMRDFDFNWHNQNTPETRE